MQWVDEAGVSEDRLKLQHEFVWRIRDALAARELTEKDFATMEVQGNFRWRRLLLQP